MNEYEMLVFSSQIIFYPPKTNLCWGFWMDPAVGSAEARLDKVANKWVEQLGLNADISEELVAWSPQIFNP